MMFIHLQIWDVLSNKEVVEIVSSCSSRSYTARTLVESAVRSWKSKYPTSKVDDCAVVCLFLDSNQSVTASTMRSKENIPEPEEDDGPGPTGCETGRDENGEVSEANEDEGDEEHANVGVGSEWSALEGVSRVNTLLTLPRFVPGKDDVKAVEERKGRS